MRGRPAGLSRANGERQGFGSPILTLHPRTLLEESFARPPREASEHGLAEVALVCVCDRRGGTAARLQPSLGLCPKKEGGEAAPASARDFLGLGLERVSSLQLASSPGCVLGVTWIPPLGGSWPHKSGSCNFLCFGVSSPKAAGAGDQLASSS